MIHKKLNIFGLACEGATDHATIAAILCGYFNCRNLDSEITKLQPHICRATQKQLDFGGWEMLLKYLKSETFRSEIEQVNYVIVQLDTDISESKLGVAYSVAQEGMDNRELSPVELVHAVIEKLITTINDGEAGFYQQYSKQIVFAICVHSLECWLHAYYNDNIRGKSKIRGCFEELKSLMAKKNIEIGLSKEFKDYKVYEKLSKDLKKRKNVDVVIEKDPSFYIFTQSLEKIEPVVLQLIAELD